MANKKITELPAATLPILGSGSRIELVQGGINVQTDPDNIGGGGTSIPFGSTTGTNSYSATMSPVVAAYADGDMYHIRVVNSSTATVTFDFGPGALKAFVTDGSQAQGGHFLAGVDYLVTYKSSLDSGAGGFLVVNELIHGLMNIRGTYTSGSSGLYPASGGSGPAAAIRHGDAFVMADSDTLGTRLVQIGDLIFTGVDVPGQTEANWYIQPGYNSLALKAPLASPALTGTPTAPTAAAATNSTQIATTAFVKTSSPKILVIDIGDEVTAVTSGTQVRTFRMPYAMTLTEVRASLKTAQSSGSLFTVDINESGTTILSTKLTIDNSEKTSVTAATPAVISDSSLADDAEITIDIDVAGTGGVGPKVTLIGY